MFELRSLKIPGSYEIRPKVIEDDRGRFVKVFHEKAFLDNKLETKFVEDYYSTSKKGVVRGMHFQLPPMEHAKLVFCVEGKVLDAIVDLRAGSPTYGEFELLELNAIDANIVYMPKGVAHGFCVTSESATLVYKVTSMYEPEYDAGIRWDSIGIDWPEKSPIVSKRDSLFPPFKNFQSPFVYE